MAFYSCCSIHFFYLFIYSKIGKFYFSHLWNRQIQYRFIVFDLWIEFTNKSHPNGFCVAHILAADEDEDISSAKNFGWRIGIVGSKIETHSAECRNKKEKTELCVCKVRGRDSEKSNNFHCFYCKWMECVCRRAHSSVWAFSRLCMSHATTFSFQFILFVRQKKKKWQNSSNAQIQMDGVLSASQQAANKQPAYLFISTFSIHPSILLVVFVDFIFSCVCVCVSFLRRKWQS